MLKLRHYIFFSLLVILSGIVRSQDSLVLTPESINGVSIANRFHVEVFEENLTLDQYLSGKYKGTKRMMQNATENFDFTSSTYFLDFVLVNPSKQELNLVLETARPIINEVSLFSAEDGRLESGDAVPFKKRALQVEASAFPIHLKAGESRHYTLRIASDGEALLIPMRFYERENFFLRLSSQQYIYGLYYGIFLFVILIYAAFYVLLKDKLFLVYTVYVLFSGLLQFALDGYLYRYFVPSGGYWADHLVILTAGAGVFFALRYASGYLQLTGRKRKITRAIEYCVLLTMALSSVPGFLTEVGYILINLFSFLGLLYMLILSLRIRRYNPSISLLYVIGMFALVIGAIVFILGNAGVFKDITISQHGLKAGALIETIFLSILMAGKYKTMQEEKEQAQQQVLVQLEEKNKLISESNVRLEAEVKERTKEIELQRLELKEKNDDLLASIKYAQRLQQALLTDKRKFQSVFRESCVFFAPRDIVSGDFFWAETIQPNKYWPKGLKVFAVADCTGHGVPGAFVSIVCSNLLKVASRSAEVNYPGEALNLIDRELQGIFNKDKGDAIKDGMDISLVAIDPDKNQLFFSGARNSLVVIRNGEEIVLEANKQSVGYSEEVKLDFKTLQLDLEEGDVIYAFSDGYPDQFGGDRGKKYLSKRLRAYLAELAKLNTEKQEELLSKEFYAWKGTQEQVDDVLVVGVRFTPEP